MSRGRKSLKDVAPHLWAVLSSRLRGPSPAHRALKSALQEKEHEVPVREGREGWL